MNGPEYFRCLLRLYGKKWIFAFISLAIITLFLSFFLDWRYSILVCFFILILFPTCVLFLFYYHGLRKRCFINKVHHTINLQEDGIEINLLYLEKQEEIDLSPTEDACLARQTNSGTSENFPYSLEAEYVISGREIIPYSALQRYYVIGSGIIFPLHDIKGGFLWIPKELCVNFDNEISFFNKLMSNIA